MIKITFTNNGGSYDAIMDASKSVREIVNEAEFTYPGAKLHINGAPVDDAEMTLPLNAFLDGGATTARITAVARKENA